jgi:hypothetical protein
VELRGPHQAVFQKLSSEVLPLPNGRTLYRTNSYTSLGTGMHAWDGKAWVPADARLEPAPGGAIGHWTAHKVAFAANLNVPGAIQIQTPDGKSFKCTVLGLAFTDYDRGHSELFASVKDCTGVIMGDSVWYAQAFEGISASVRWLQSKAGCEQDVVLEGDLPSPADYGCAPDTTRVELWTEFMRMDLGQAFLIEPAAPDGRGEALAPCGKSWIRLENRQFLVEKIDYLLLHEQLRRLPQGAGIRPKANGARLMADARVKGPIVRPFPRAPALPGPELLPPMQVAAVKPTRRGVIVDFSLLSSGGAFVLEGSKTYFVSTNVSFTSLVEWSREQWSNSPKTTA